ncbi:TPA: glycosyltransferase family 1 protein [Clostridium perfringens]|nr:glycosyltransferase family 1 protein [Clostridium perfringens]
MKILYICTVDLSKNGIATFILNYFELLVNSGVHVDILASNIVDDEIKDLIEKKNMKLYIVPQRKKQVIKYFFSVLNILKKEKYNVCHVHGNSCSLAIELFAALLSGCKARIAHSHTSSCNHKFIHKLLRPIFEISCNKRFACSDKAGKWLFNNKEFIVLKNGINLDKYKFDYKNRDKIRSQLNIKDDEILIGHVGYFEEVKNHRFLINLFNKLHKTNSKYKLICIGDGSLRDNIANMVNKLNLNKEVLLIGNVSNVNEYLSAMDLFLLPSLYEGLPFVLIEAQASGLVCLTSNSVSIEANISNNVEFIKLYEDDWINLINKIILNKYNRNINKEIFKEKGYDLKNNKNQILKYYQEMLN